MNEQTPTGDEKHPRDTPAINEPESETSTEADAQLDADLDENSEDDENNEALEAEEIEVSWTEFKDGTPHWERKDEPSTAPRNEERVSKLMARGGIASRRAAEEIITEGRVSVNGHFIREPGAKADPIHDRIVIDNRPLILSDKEATILLLHKPKYVMTTRDDQGKRVMVMDLLPHKYQKLHPVGRLDYETTGVLLLSDDGELTNLLTHPSHGVEKVYEARVRGEVTREEVARLEGGIYLDDVRTAPCRVRVVAQREKNALIEISLFEGRNRQVRRMLEAVGHPASSLRRIKFGGVELEGLEPGSFRELLPGEVKQLRKHAEEGLKVAKKRTKAAQKNTGKPAGKSSRPGAGKNTLHPKFTPDARQDGARPARPNATEGASAGARPNRDRPARNDTRAPRDETRAPRDETTKPNFGPRPPRETRPARDQSRAPRNEIRASRDDRRTPKAAPKGPSPEIQALRANIKVPKVDDKRAPRDDKRAPQTDKRTPSDDKTPLSKRIEKKWR